MERSRVLAIDLGERRMGLALSDPLGLAASALPTAERRNRREDLNYLKSLIKKHEVSIVLVGNPLNMDGSSSPSSERAVALADRLREHAGVEVRLWDERLTSLEAERILKDRGEVPRQQPGRVDQLAAVLLLEDYLQSRRLAEGHE